MKILLVIDSMHPRDGGPPVVVANSAIALRKRGHEVIALSLADQADVTAIRNAWTPMLNAGAELVFHPQETLSAFRGFSGKADGISELVATSDVVHIHSVWSPFAWFIGRTASRMKKPYFVSSHGVFDHRAMTRIRSKWLKKRLAIALFDIKGFLDSAAGVVFGSPAEAENSWLATPNLKLAFIPNGAELPKQAAPTQDQMSLLYAAVPEAREWKRLLLCRSRIHEEKGHDLLVAAFDAVAADFPFCGLLIAGLKQDEALEAKVRKFIENSRFKERIALTTDLKGPETNFLYQVCDAYVAPSIAEGFSMSLVEAMAYGRPMLLTRFCHMPIVEDAGAGIIVEPRVDSIAAGLRRLLSQPEEGWQMMRESASRLFVEQFTWDSVAEKLDQRYQLALQ